MAWNASKWSERFTLKELVTLEAEATRLGKRQRIDELRWAITFKLAEARTQRGDPVPTNGYSGRNSKRRR